MSDILDKIINVYDLSKFNNNSKILSALKGHKGRIYDIDLICTIKIEIGNTIKKQEENNLTRQEIEKIKQKLHEDYGVEYDEIRINSI